MLSLPTTQSKRTMTASIPFEVREIETASFHPIVQAQVAGSTIYMILDTGASRTVVNRELLEELPRMNQPHQEAFAAGINAQQLKVEQVQIPTIQIGDYTFTEMVVFATDLQAVSDLYEQMAGIRIDGLLGCDFLENHKAVVDFKKRSILLKTKLLPINQQG